MNFSFLETRPLIVVLFMLVGSFLFKNAWFTKMSEGDKVPKDVKGDLRSVLISSNGVKESRVEKDYHELSGKKLMWKNYGFKSLNAFLSALPDVCVIQYSAKDRENRVYGVQLEGTFMSSHAKKNSKVASTGISPVKQQIVPESGRLVEKDGSSFKITLSNLDQKASVSDEGTDDLKPNANGLFQVYISKLPESCSESDLKACFGVYGKVAECQMMRSSIRKKIGFVRYKLKEEALRALTEGKKNPPKIHGIQLEVAKPKSKSSSGNETGSEFSETSQSSTPSSPIKSASVSSVGQESPTKSNTLTGQKLPQKQFANSQVSGPLPGSFPHSTVAPVSQGPVPPNPPTELPTHIVKTPLTVQVPTSQQSTTTVTNKDLWKLNPDHSAKTLLSVHTASQVPPGNDKNINKTVSSQPKTTENKSLFHGQYSVIISGYDSKVSEASLKLAIQNVPNFDRLEYHPLYSIAWFRRQDAVTQAVNELNGKLINGCCILVKPLKENSPVSRESKPANVIREEKLPELQNDFSKIYDFYSEAISRWREQQYLSWLNNLPSIFEVKIMDLIDPCTYWVHLSDGTSAYQAFNDLSHRLSYFNPSADLRHLNKNEFGAGKYSDDDLWYRCYCREVSADGRYVHVIYIDYGNTEWLKRERTVLLADFFFELRPQGVLAKLSGLRYNSNNNSSVDNSVLSSANKLLMCQCFQARKASEVFSKSFMLEMELLQSKGESVFNELSSLPGVETQHRQSSPVPPLLLSTPPPIPTILKPLKDRLSHVNAEALNIWITDIRSPTAFYFQLVRSEALEAIRQIQEMLLKCNVQNKVMDKDPKISGIVCHHKNGLERSRVTVLQATNTPGKVTVLHVDTGRVSVVPLTSFIALPSEATNICFQARPAQLYGVPHEPLAQSSQALEFLIQQATQVLRAIVVSENKDESVVVELFNSEGTSINKAMLEMATPPPDEVSARSQVLPQNQASPSSAIPVAFQNGVSPSSSGQASPNQIPVQVSPAATFPQMQTSPNQASSLNQVPPHPPFTQNPARPDKTYTQTQATSYQAQVQGRPSQALGQNQISPTLPNQLLTKSQASVNQRNQTSFNQGVGQNQAKSYPASAPSQISPQKRVSLNQAPPQSQASPNHPTPPNRINQAPTQSRASSNQAPRQRGASSNQAPPQSRASPNQAFASNQLPPQNQAFAQNQAPPQNRGQGQISPNQNIHLSQIPPNQAFGQNRVNPNQGFAQKNSTTQQISSPISPQISSNQNNNASQASHNKAFGHDQTQPQKQPSPNQAFSGGSINQTLAHKPPQSYQAPPENRAPSNQNANRHQAVRQNTTQSREAPLQGQPAQTGVVQGHSNSFTNTMEKTPQSSVALPNSRFCNAAVPKVAQNSQENNLSNTSPNAIRMASQCPASQTNNPGGFSKGVSTPQVITSQHPTSKNRAALPHSTTSQGHTSQGPGSSLITSQEPASSIITSQGATSSTSASRNEMGGPSFLAQFSKTRSNSNASSTSKNSFHSEENWDELDTNTDDTNRNLNELQSPDNTIGSEKTKDTGQSNKPRSSAQSKKEQTQTKNNPKNFAFGQSGAGKVSSMPAEINSRSLPEKGVKVNAKGLRSVKTKLLEQEKVLSISGPKQREALEMYKTREKRNLISKVKMLENENLMLEGEIKRNRKVKAELEKQLGL